MTLKINDQLKAIGDIMGTKKSGYIVKFGQFNGDDISDVPSHYLKWGIDNLTNNKFITEAEKELEHRSDS